MATEILTLKVKDGFTPDDLQKTIGFLTPSPQGLHSYHWGRAVTDPQTVLFFLNWESIADHAAFTKSGSYDTFRETLTSQLASPAGISTYVTNLAPFPATEVFNAGIIYVAALAKKPDVSRETFETTRNTLMGIISQTPGFEAYAYGVKQGETDVYIVMMGWQSFEVHSAFAASRPDVRDAMWGNAVLERSSFMDVKLFRQ